VLRKTRNTARDLLPVGGWTEIGEDMFNDNAPFHTCNEGARRVMVVGVVLHWRRWAKRAVPHTYQARRKSEPSSSPTIVAHHRAYSGR
jgi:hypothetical protein